MQVFLDLVLTCNRVYVIPFPDGSIGAGQAKEIDIALKNGIKVIYYKLFGSVEELFSLDNYRVMSIKETRKKLKKGTYNENS